MLAPDVRTLKLLEDGSEMERRDDYSSEILFKAAREAIETANNQGARMRLLGGIAVRQLAPSASRPPLARSYHDYDVVVASRDGASAAGVFRSLGYSEDSHFNALHGAQRLIFTSNAGFDVDVLVGSFQMCHRLDLAIDLPGTGMTVHPADLLLTKLQIVQIEDKDLRDTAALLHDLPVSTGKEGAIDPDRFVRPLAGSWGFYHTVDLNLSKVDEYAKRVLDHEMADTVSRATANLKEAMESSPKSMKWKMRARVGEKVTWYELPEEV